MPVPAENKLRTLWRRALLISLVVGTVVALGWLSMQIGRLRSELEQVRSQQQAASVERQTLEARELELEDELERSRTETAALQLQQAEREERIADLERKATSPVRMSSPLVASMVLSGVRSEDHTLKLPDAADFAELYVDLEGDDGYASFRAVLTTATGAHLSTHSDLPVRVTEWGSEVVVRLPAGLLGEDGYRLTLEGRDASGVIHALGSHRFNVVRGPA